MTEDSYALSASRIFKAIEALPDNIKPGTAGSTACPNCDTRLSWSRSRNGHVWLVCGTERCVGPSHLNIPRDERWPR